MGSELLKMLALLPRGVNFRERRDADFTLKATMTDDPYQISLDINDEYTFTQADFCFSEKNHQVFYDKNDKILEYTYDGQFLSLHISTIKQTNLFLDISMLLCSIHSIGPLCIRGQFNIECELDIKALSLSFDGFLSVQHALTFSITEGLSLDGEIDTNTLGIQAGHCHQLANVLVHDHCDIATQVFRKTSSSCFKTKMLRLIADICKIDGQMEVHSAIFLASHHLFVGDLNHQTFINFPSHHYIHIGKGSLIGHTRMTIGHAEEGFQNAQWLFDETINISPESQIECHNTSIHGHKMDNQGTFFLNHCHVNMKIFYMTSGCFHAAESNWAGSKIYVFAGKWIVKDKSVLVLADKLFVDGAATAEMTTSEVGVANHISFYGQSKVANCHLKTKNLLFQGHLRLKDLVIDATSIEYHSSNALLIKNSLKAKYIFLSGSTKKKNFIFKNSHLVAKYFTVDEQVYMEKTSMVGIDDAKVAHIIQGQLTLNHSRWITDSRICSLVGARIHPCEFSEIISSSIDSSGVLSVDDSLVQCDDLNLQHATTALRNGLIYVKHRVGAQASLLSLDDDSELSAENMHISHKSQLRLKKSSLLVTNRIVSGYDSKLQSEASRIVSKKIVFQGKTGLIHTLLSAEELFLYERFLIQKSNIHADKKIAFADTAEAKLTKSTLSSQNIESFGHLHMRDSQAYAKNRMALWTGSQTILEGETVIKAHDDVLRGELITQKVASKCALKPTVIAKNRLYLSNKAKITGNEDLCLLADTVDQTGTIELQASLLSKGRLFNHVNQISADSIYFGFDDAVVNQGSISAKNIQLHSNLMNIFGRISAQQTMSTSGFVSFNMGLIAANNYMNDSFVSMNTGLIAPNFSADPKYIFSRSNLLSTARTLALMWAPMHTSGIQLAFMLPSFLSNVGKLYQNADRRNLSRIFDMKRHELMPFLCQVKSLFLLGSGLYHHGQSACFGEEASAWTASVDKAFSDYHAYANDWWNTIQTTDWQQVGYQTAEAFTGSYVDSSILHVNVGASIAMNTSESSLLHVNVGDERSLFSHNINTHTLLNLGSSTGSESTFLATNIKNKGTLSGGQRFNLKANRVDNEGGCIQGRRGVIAIGNLSQLGRFDFKDGYVHIDSFQDNKSAQTLLSQVMLKGKRLDSVGTLRLNDHSTAIIDDVNFASDAHPELIDSDLVVHSLKDDSHLSYAGQSNLIVDAYHHTGYLKSLDPKSTLYIYAKKAELEGGGDLDHVIYDIEHFSDAAQFVAGTGRYSKYGVSQSLSFITNDGVSLTDPIERDCDIAVTASDIMSGFDYDKAHQLSFTSTQGDIKLNNSLRALNIYVNSAGRIFNNGTAYASDKLFYNAKGNIENRGVVGSGKYTQLVAKGNVIALCEDQSYQGQFDTRHNYRPAIISGGSGADTEGIGLFIQAEGEVISDASDFVSEGSNYIEGKKGVHFNANSDLKIKH